MYAGTRLPGAWCRRFFICILDIFDQVHLKLAAEKDWALLWGAAFFAGGIGTYFSLTMEPSSALRGFLASVLFVLVGAMALSVQKGWDRLAISALVMVALLGGFLCAQWSALRSEAPVLERAVPPVTLEGSVVRVEPLPVGQRVLLDRVKIPDFRFGAVPSRVRLTVRMPASLIPGQRVRVRAGLLPPPQPATPGGYDFQRIAWFEGIGAVGYAVSVPDLVEGQPTAGWPSAEPLRQVIGERLRKGLSGDGGAVAAALLTGERHAISPTMTNAYRDAGLSHLLAISGLNIGIYAGIVFVVVRGGFAFVPAVALRWDVKKLAALLALLATTFYLLVSGSNVPAVRSWLMGGVVLLSIVLDRKAISFRVLGIAAFLVLLWQPESILGPSFQMSFAAVLSLVSGYMVFHPSLANWRASAPGPVSAAWRAGAIYLFGIIASTLLATVATAPYAIYHFHRLPLYGLLANLVAVPVTSIWVMPWLILALALMPFGMEHIALVPLGWGLDVIGDVAVFIADLPYASLHTPPMSSLALVVATLSGLWFCIWQGRWRWWSSPFLVVALFSPWIWPDTPHLLVSGNGKLAAVHDGTGLVLSPGRSDGFTRSMWLERWGEGLEHWDRWGAGDGPLRCDLYGCLYRQHGRVISLAYREEAIVEDCGQVDILVTHHKVPSSSFLRRGCKGTHFVDGRALASEGSHVFYFDSNKIQIRTVSAWQGKRLWSRRDIQGKKKEGAASTKKLPAAG